MRRILEIGSIIISASLFSGCDNSIDPLPFSEYEKVTVNAYFYYPNDKEVYLGQMVGASAGGSAARSFTRRKIFPSSNWSYICCTVEKGSECYRKIR